MLATGLKFITKELNLYLNNRFGGPEDGNRVILSNFVELDGKAAVEEKDKIIVSLVNLEQDTTSRVFGSNSSGDRRSSSGTNPQVNLNAYILISAYFKQVNYYDSLVYLSGIISFFQGKFVFTKQNSPYLAETDIDKLIFEMVNLNFQEISHVWSGLGGEIYALRFV